MEIVVPCKIGKLHEQGAAARLRQRDECRGKICPASKCKHWRLVNTVAVYVHVVSERRVAYLGPGYIRKGKICIPQCGGVRFNAIVNGA